MVGAGNPVVVVVVVVVVVPDADVVAVGRENDIGVGALVEIG